MRHTPVHKLIKQRGFTLVEVLVISPFIILLIGGFIALIVGLTGESLQLRVKNASAYDVQAALDEMEANASRATNFLTSTTGITVSPQGKNNSSAPFTNTSGTDPNTLITMSPATTKSPFDSTRGLIYQGTGACNSSNPTYNYVTVFFVDTSTSTLYKRTILPQSPACDQPWQRASCSEANVSSTPAVCKVADEKLLDGVENIKIDYYASAATDDTNATTADAAKSVKVSISLSKQAAGNAVTYSGSMRTTSINAGQQSPTQSVAAPEITSSRNTSSPYVTDFAWEKTGNATGYNIRYRMGSSTWQNGPQNQNPNTTTYSVTANARKQNADIEVTALLAGGGTYVYPVKATAIPSWNECSPLNGWQNYDTTFNTQGFTKTTSGAVGLKGLIRSGPVGYNGSYVSCYLPAGFRPANHLIFNAVAYDPNGIGSNGSARIDIFTDGGVLVSAGSGGSNTNGFVSLDGIIFMAPSGNPNWTAGTWLNSWYFNSYSDTYPNVGYWKDSLGRSWVQGLGTGGNTNYVSMFSMPNSMSPDGNLHYPVSTDNRVGAVNVYSGANVGSRLSLGGYASTQLLYYSTGGLNSLPLYNGWVNYDTYWSNAKCYQGADDIVIMQGLVRAGTASAGGLTHVGACGPSPYMSTGRRALFTGLANPDKQGRMDLPTDGYLYPLASDPGWTSLDGIHYIAN